MIETNNDNLGVALGVPVGVQSVSFWTKAKRFITNQKTILAALAIAVVYFGVSFVVFENQLYAWQVTVAKQLNLDTNYITSLVTYINTNLPVVSTSTTK